MTSMMMRFLPENCCQPSLGFVENDCKCALTSLEQLTDFDPNAAAAAAAAADTLDYREAAAAAAAGFKPS